MGYGRNGQTKALRKRRNRHIIQPIELGLDTFGDITAGADGEPLSHAQVIRDVIEEGVLADEVGVDAFGVGEHHRRRLRGVRRPTSCSPRSRRAPSGSGSARRSRCCPRTIRSACSSASRRSMPFPTGAPKSRSGRGSFTESFPLFGYRSRRLRKAVRGKARSVRGAAQAAKPVTWQGTTRPPLNNQRVFPPVETGTLADLDRRRRQSRNPWCARRVTICR